MLRCGTTPLEPCYDNQHKCVDCKRIKGLFYGQCHDTNAQDGSQTGAKTYDASTKTTTQTSPRRTDLMLQQGGFLTEMIPFFCTP